MNADIPCETSSTRNKQILSLIFLLQSSDLFTDSVKRKDDVHLNQQGYVELLTPINYHIIA
jgi:hypothetical protein